MRELSATSCGSLWVQPEIIKSLERESFRVRQQFISALTLLVYDGLAVRSPDDPTMNEQGWALLCHPSDQSPLSFAGVTLWWCGPISSDPLDGGRDRLTLQYTLNHQAPSALLPTSELALFEPLSSWVRNPEHASLRRAFLTQRGDALIVRAARGSGLTTALSSAISDWLATSSSDCLFITKNVARARHMISALHGDTNRVKVIHPKEAISCLIGKQTDQSSQRDLAQLGWTQDQLIDELSYLDLYALTSHRHDELMTRLCQTHLKEQGIAEHWVHALPSMMAMIKRFFYASGEPRPFLLRDRSLRHLTQEMREELLSIMHSLWSSPLSLSTRLIKDSQPDVWPWPEARALVWDDCLSIPWVVLFRFLTYADENMGASGRRWSLTLAGELPEATGAGGSRWSEIESLVTGSLGRSLSRIDLRRNERLPQTKLTSLWRLFTQFGRDHELKNRQPVGLASVISFSHPSKLTPDHRSLWHISQSDNQKEMLLRILRACAGTPQARILDLSDRSRGESTLMGILGEIPTSLSRCVITHTELNRSEWSWLFVYTDYDRDQTKQLPPSLLERCLRPQVQSLWYLLTRTANPLIWLGDAPLSFPSQEMTLHETLDRVSQTSPLGGERVFDQIERARVLTVTRDFIKAREAWGEIWGTLPYVLDKEDLKSTKAQFEELLNELFRTSIQSRNWAQTIEVIKDLELVHSEKTTTLPPRFLFELSVNLKEQLQLGEEARAAKHLDPLIDSLRVIGALLKFDLTQDDRLLISSSLKRWSLELLDERLPQKTIQLHILELLCKLTQSKHLMMLLTGYQEEPTPTRLTDQASQVLHHYQNTPNLDAYESRWSRAHLTRWLTYLLDPRRPPPFHTLEWPTLASGYALVAMNEGRWEKGKALYELSMSLTNVTRLDDTEQVSTQGGEGQLEDEHCRRTWRTRAIQLLDQRPMSEQLSQLRQNGDLDALINHLREHRIEPSHEIKTALTLRDSLIEMRSCWHLLSPQEKDQLSSLWNQLLDETHLPKTREL